jgi:hypothetical protein
MIEDFLLVPSFIIGNTKTCIQTKNQRKLQIPVIDLQNNKITHFIQYINGKEQDVTNTKTNGQG